ncbi:MAG: TVP38/TMEM64 family protein [Cetobacterium sp.]
MLNNKKIIKRVILLLFLLMILFGLKESNVLEYLKDRKNLEELIKSLGVWGPISYIGLYAAITITCVSTLPLTLAGGIIFGPIIGIVYTVIGACLGLSLSFLIARYILKSPIEKKFGDTEVFKKINEGVKNDGWFILATTRLLPVFPFGIQNYIYGLTSISFIKYSLLSTLFILPGTSVFVLLAGAVTSGDMKTAIKISIIASLIFFLLTVLTKIIAKKKKVSKK